MDRDGAREQYGLLASLGAFRLQFDICQIRTWTSSKCNNGALCKCRITKPGLDASSPLMRVAFFFLLWCLWSLLSVVE